MLADDPARIKLLRNEVGAAACFERGADPCHAGNLDVAELEHGVVRNAFGFVGTVDGVEQLERGLVGGVRDAADLRERPRAVAAQLAMALRKTQIEDTAQLGGLLTLADPMTAMSSRTRSATARDSDEDVSVTIQPVADA